MTLNKLTFDKWMNIMEIIVAEPNDTISGIVKKCGCTYSHVVDIINILREYKLVTTKHVGRSTFINPTADGKIVAKAISTILYIVEENKNE